MKIHVPTITIKLHADASTTLVLPSVQLGEEDGGKVVTLLMSMANKIGPLLEECLHAIGHNAVVGTLAFDQQVFNAMATFKAKVPLTPEGQYALKCLEQVEDALSFYPKTGQTFAPASGRKALNLVFELGQAISHLSKAQYLKPGFLYQSKGTWTLMGAKGVAQPHFVHIAIATPFTMA